MNNFKTTITLEIEIPVKCYISGGIPATMFEPEEPIDIEIDFNEKEIIDIVEKEIEQNRDSIEDEILTEIHDYNANLAYDYHEYKKELREDIN